MPRWFSVAWVPKLLLPPVRIRIFGPKTAKFGPKYTLLVILGQIWTFSPLFVPCPTKKQCEQGALVVVPKLLLSPVRIRDFDQKQPNLTQNWHFWSFRATPCQLIWCSVGGLVGGFGARAVSRNTLIYSIYYMYHISYIYFSSFYK